LVVAAVLVGFKRHRYVPDASRTPSTPAVDDRSCSELVIAAGTGQANDQVALSGRMAGSAVAAASSATWWLAFVPRLGNGAVNPMGPARVYVVPSNHLQHEDQLEGLENKCQLLG